MFWYIGNVCRIPATQIAMLLWPHNYFPIRMLDVELLMPALPFFFLRDVATDLPQGLIPVLSFVNLLSIACNAVDWIHRITFCFVSISVQNTCCVSADLRLLLFVLVHYLSKRLGGLSPDARHPPERSPGVTIEV